MKNNESIYTYNVEYMGWFVRQSMEGGRCSTLNQYENSIISDEVIIINSKELEINGNICEILDKYVEFRNKHGELLENGVDSQFEDYRDINQYEKAKYLNGKLS